jgi:uncharacterized protein YecT (DUF1311 family)
VQDDYNLKIGAFGKRIREACAEPRARGLYLKLALVLRQRAWLTLHFHDRRNATLSAAGYEI